MIFLQRPVNVLHFEIIPQAEAIRLHSRLMFSGLSVKLFLLSPQQQLTNHLGSPILYLVVRLLQWSLRTAVIFMVLPKQGRQVIAM